MLGALPGSMLCSARLLPSILTAYEQMLLVKQFRADVLSDLPIDEEKLMQALTLPNAVMGYDYQQLEFLGDCVLKLIASCIVFCNDGMAGEGALTRRRTQTISNEHLTMISKRLQVAQHVFGSEAVPKNWQAHGAWQRSVRMSDKMSADLIEAILGAAWSSGGDATAGLQTALDCFNKLHLISQRVSLEDFRTRFDLVWLYKNEEVRYTDRSYVTRMESTLGYKFKHTQLAIEAITHSSISSILKPSYERLEFLGDAVLEVCVVQLFHGLFPTFDEGEYSHLKSAAASNVSLGVACLNTELSRLLMDNCPAIQQSIEKFRTQVILARTNAEEDGQHNQPFWSNISCPKQLGDIVESTLGAVFVDSGFDLEASRKVFNHLFQTHFLTYFNK
ncbi:ribonuclease III [Meira miltonrushii]|uniref:Ribonuclease III n=1 Tax=Meira miltonrushii TaxID=1280837 RepID=A0A316VQZ4_9BASI|nr:ribonuclease III [Meira miltonrushii]PWN37925.1 ribonuclease III [Meira miltonrushii]